MNREEFLKSLDHLKSLSKEDLEKMDPIDREALKGYQYLDDGAEASQVLKNLDARFQAKLPEKNAPISTRQTRIFTLRKLAAALLLLLIPAYFLLKPSSTESLYQQHFEAPRSTYFQVSRGAASERTDLDAAFQAYATEDYQRAATLLDDLIIEHPDKPDLKFYQAISLLASNQVEDAIDLFKDCLDISYQNTDRKSSWYLAMSYLKLGDKEQAQFWLSKTVQVDDEHRSAAQELLTELQ